jgi:hypothetical protein
VVSQQDSGGPIGDSQSPSIPAEDRCDHSPGWVWCGRVQSLIGGHIKI